MKEYYVYIHYLVDNKEIFYVGKGTGKRAWSKSSRSLEWKEKTKNAYNVWIIKTFHSEEEAFQLRELNELVQKAIAVDDFSAEELQGLGFNREEFEEPPRLKVSVLNPSTQKIRS